MDESETTAGDRLLRSDAVARAAGATLAQVQEQVAGALHGPFAGALAAGASAQNPESGPDAAALLSGSVPQRFIAAGAAISAAYGALAEGDDVATAGALLCAERILFPHDPEGAAAVASAAEIAVRRLDEDAASPAPSPTSPDAAAAMQQRVLAETEALGRAYQAAAAHLQVAALGARSWKAVTGGVSAGADAALTQFGPFLDGLVRWAFFVEVALRGARRDDWARVGAALFAARSDVRRGSAG